MTDELKPCPNPWCPSRTAPVPCALKRDGWNVRCACGVVTFRHATEAEAVTAWNARAEAPTRVEGGELVEMLVEAVRFSSWAAGQGICPAEGQPARAPDEFLMEYSDATGEEDWETMADRLPSILAALSPSPAVDRGARSIVSDLLNQWPQDSVPSGPLLIRASRFINEGNVDFTPTRPTLKTEGETP